MIPPPGKPADVIFIPLAIQQLGTVSLDEPGGKRVNFRVPLRRIHQAFQPFRLRVGIRVQQCQPLPLRQPGCQVVGCGKSPVFLQLFQAHLQPGVSFLQVIHAAIPGAVIHHDHLEILERLRL